MDQFRRHRGRVADRLRRRRAADDGDSWVMTCPCGTTVSIWDLGGMRYRISKKGLSRSVECPSCRQRFVGRVRRVTV